MANYRYKVVLSTSSPNADWWKYDVEYNHPQTGWESLASYGILSEEAGIDASLTLIKEHRERIGALEAWMDHPWVEVD